MFRSRRRSASLLRAVGVALAVVAVGAALVFVLWPGGEDAPIGLAATVQSGPAQAVPQTTVAGPPQTTTTEPRIEITIAAVGDVMINIGALRTAMDNEEREYDFYPIFAPVAPYLSAADYTVANLETKLAGPTLRYTSYPRYNSPDAVADALLAAGVDLVTTANNHAMDKDWFGVVDTLACLDDKGLAHVGTHRSPAEKEKTSPLVVDIQGVKVGFINYTDYLNGLSVPKEHRAYGVNLLQDADQVAREAEAARKAGADIVIALLHWGREYSSTQNAQQVELAIGTAEEPGLLHRGVDVILGSHPHVLQPMTCVHREATLDTGDGYVVYSMGNFLSTMKRDLTDHGVIVYVHIQKVGDVARVTGLSYMGVWVQESGSYPRKIRILPVLPGIEPQTDTGIGARSTGCMEEAWEYLHGMYYRPEENIRPLEAADLPADPE